MFAFARFVATEFMRSSERTPQNYTGTPSSLAAIRIADGVCPKCKTHPRARARVIAIALAIAGCRKKTCVDCAGSSGDLLPPSPPAEKATAR
jgi:hypothetical protein